MQRSVIQVRPKNSGSDSRLYSPNRDLAYIYIPAMREAIHNLDQCNWTDDVRELVRQTGITESDIGRAVECVTQAHAYFVNHTNIAEPLDALQQTEFFQVPYAARYLVLSRLGEVLLGGFFVAVRDVTMQGDLPPQWRELAELVAFGSKIMAYNSGIVEVASGYVVIQRALAAAKQETELVNHAHVQSQHLLYAMTRQHDADAMQHNETNSELCRLNALGFWQSVKWAFDKLFSRKLRS